MSTNPSQPIEGEEEEEDESFLEDEDYLHRTLSAEDDEEDEDLLPSYRQNNHLSFS